MGASPAADVIFCLRLTKAIGQTRGVEEIYAVALSSDYQRTCDGFSPWHPQANDPELFVVPDTAAARALATLRPVLQAERIGALIYVPLIAQHRGSIHAESPGPGHGATFRVRLPTTWS